MREEERQFNPAQLSILTEAHQWLNGNRQDTSRLLTVHQSVNNMLIASGYRHLRTDIQLRGDEPGADLSEREIILRSYAEWTLTLTIVDVDLKRAGLRDVEAQALY